MVDPKETRETPRKVLRCAARVALNGAKPISGRSMDISIGGASIMVPEALPLNASCLVGLEPSINGKLVRLVLKARVAYCSCIGTEGFRIGFQFLQLDEAAMRTLRQLTS